MEFYSGSSYGGGRWVRPEDDITSAYGNNWGIMVDSPWDDGMSVEEHALYYSTLPRHFLSEDDEDED